MGYLITVAAIYLARYFPSFFSRPLLVLPLLSIAAVVLIWNRKGELYVVIIALLFSLLSESVVLSFPDTSISEDSVVAFYGEVIQDSQQKKGRTSGFRILLSAVEDRKGNLFNASGNIYVISEQSDFYYGDEVYVKGNFSGPVIYASASRLLSRSFISSLRVKAIGSIKEAFRSFEGGELASLLVLGTGSDGSFVLSSDARRSGLSHVLALSGMHLSIIAMLIAGPLVFLFGKQGGKMILYMILFLFSFLSGWRPSLVRAFIFRLVIGLGVDLEESFILSLVLLIVFFPESIADLGAQYSFISLGGIFILSSSLEKAIRFFTPLPRAITASVAASASALIFSIPVTALTFGSYQLGAIITSLPFNTLISIYMILSLFSLVFPFLGVILDALFHFMEWAFSIAGSFPESSGLGPYLILSFAVSAVIILHVVIDNANLLSSKHVDSELQ